MSSERDFDLAHYRALMDERLSVLKTEFSGLRTGRASSALVDRIPVESYGIRVPLNQIATISVPESRMISIQVWDRSQTDAVVRAICESSLGLNPIAEGSVIRLPIPELNQERRQELAKVAHKYAEQARVGIRHVRRDAIDALKALEKAGRIGEDALRSCIDDVQDVTDEMVKSVDRLMHAKEAEIMQV